MLFASVFYNRMVEEVFMEIKSWQDYFLDLAKTCASRSNCLRAQVGAVIVGEDKKIKLNPEPDMKLADQFMLNKTQLFRQDKIDVKMPLCIFGGIISFVFCVKDLLFNQE